MCKNLVTVPIQIQDETHPTNPTDWSVRPVKLFDSCVTLFIVLNTAFLAAEHHGMSQELKDVLDMGNKVSHNQ